MKKNLRVLLVGLLAVVGLVVFAGCGSSDEGTSGSSTADRAEADIDWQFISPADMKKVVEDEDAESYYVVDIQPEEDFAKGHLPNSIELAAYPVDTKELEDIVTDSAEQMTDDENPIYVMCPGGGAGAKRTVSVLIDAGIDESRLYIIEDGAKGWPYKDDADLWVQS